MNDKEKGFTLLETLVALSILSILLLIPTITFPNLSAESKQAALIAKQVKDDLLLAQHVAMSTGRSVSVAFDDKQQTYTIRFHTNDIYRTSAHKSILYERVNLGSTITFLGNGHPSQSGTFFLWIGDTRFRYTIYLGKGMISYTKF
ncbi:prepilin-type N-terminal cleavage/methylation domain-containing protein [bacterium LRH843]|nr:prepilin-type N-terminal cleavage/methylation domain-containing protein [bacterium LRH843]